jgi:glyoxylase-like metal-dependent hydrolase (beta-lactamase superfamily II)
MKSAPLLVAALLAYGSLGLPVFAQATDGADFMGPEAAKTKMRLVVQEAIHQSHSALEKGALQSGRVFANLMEKDTAIVGIAIPAVGSANQMFVTFPIEHFRDSSVDALAKEALQDLARSADKLKEFAAKTPEWCRALPRPEYKTLQRVLPDEPWFEVYKVAPGVFAIYEPHQAEEVISYLIVGQKQAVLFDTGMGIGDIRKVTTRLTSRPVVVLNSHTHNDHVGGNWQFTFVYGMDTEFTRTNAKGSREDAQAEIAPGQLCGDLPKGFNPKTYATKPWKISHAIHDGFTVNLGGRKLEILATPGHTPDAISLIDRENGLLFTGDTYYPAPIWLYRPETDLDAYVNSVKRIAALAPELKLVLGAHNVPVAQPEVLPRLVTAIQAVRSGQGSVKPLEEGKAIHSLDGFSFLLAASKKEKD